MKHLRKEAGFSAEDAARLARVTRPHIHAVERGAWWPSMDLLQELARIYRVDTADFFIFPEKKHLRDRGRELLRLVPNTSLAAVVSAIEQAAGKTLEQLISEATPSVVTADDDDDASPTAAPAKRRAH